MILANSSRDLSEFHQKYSNAARFGYKDSKAREGSRLEE
jgi:hypothetical protein